MNRDQLDARVRAIVERTVRDQGLQLQVRDPLTLRLVASLVPTTPEHEEAAAA